LTTHAGGGAAGPRHLAALAREPRSAGSAAEGRAREYAAAVLRDAGFDVRTEPFTYSAFPGRFATPIGGALVAATVVIPALFGLTGHPLAALGVLGGGTALVTLWVRAMMRDAVLDVPLLRAQGENLVATRGVKEGGGARTPRVWLVAHLDSKSQPVPTAARIAGVLFLVASLALAVVAALLQLAALPDRMAWWAALGAVVLGAPPVIASVVGVQSHGALDNASGVAAVLEAVGLMRPEVAIGVLLPSAEELGLAGARAWARARTGPPAVAINCDGVDDEGEITIMYTGHRPGPMLAVMRGVDAATPRVRRMPLGLLTDSVALADRGWHAVTVSRGSFRTLRRVHSTRDSLDNLTGSGIGDVALLLARASEALA
jgi:hypothetical protein